MFLISETIQKLDMTTWNLTIKSPDFEGFQILKGQISDPNCKTISYFNLKTKITWSADMDLVPATVNRWLDDWEKIDWKTPDNKITTEMTWSRCIFQLYRCRFIFDVLRCSSFTVDILECRYYIGDFSWRRFGNATSNSKSQRFLVHENLKSVNFTRAAKSQKSNP